MIRVGEDKSLALLLVILSGILFVRLISLWFNNSELFFDEAQYWYWAQSLDFGYFSKPPLLALIISGSTQLCGDNSEFCVRLSAPILHVATAFVIFVSAAELFDRKTAFWAAIIYVTLPAVSLSSTIISTDVPLLFCWSVALYAYVRLWRDGTLIWAIILGIAIGLGLNAKYAMAYFVGCAIIHSLIEQRHRSPPRNYGFWLAVGIAVLMLVPNVIWNVSNGFVTLSHTGENIGWDGLDPNWMGLGEFVGSQFGVFGPILFGIFLATAYKMASDSISREHRFLLAFSLPILLLLVFQALLSKAYANWAATTYIAATILVAEIMVNRIPWSWLRSSLILHGVVFAALALAVCFAGPGQLVLPNGTQPFARTQGASLIANEARKLLEQQEYNALVATDRKLSALMQYNLRDREEAILAWRGSEVSRDHFELKAAFQDSPRDPALVISRQNDAAKFKGDFSNVINLGSRSIGAGEIGKVYFFRLEGYKDFD